MKLSVVIPVRNEAQSVGELADRLAKVFAQLDCQCEAIFVDDGSTDDTWQKLSAVHAGNDFVRLIRLSRNFGKELALTAGLDSADGDAVVLMDGDLQHPPEVISKMVALYRNGHEVVYGVRADRDNESAWRRTMTGAFYRLFNLLSETHLRVQTGDFRLMSRRVVDALKLLRERSRFMKGIYSWVGFDGIGIEFVAPPRFHGRSSFGVVSLFNLAFTGLVSFSTFPLKVGLFIGAMFALAAMVLGTFYFGRTLFLGIDVPGYASTIISVLALNGLILLQLGLIGLYVARIYEEVKGRPLYIVRDSVAARPTPGRPIAGSVPSHGH